MDFLLRTIVLLLGVLGTDSVWTVSKITAQSGGTVSIPCHYHWLHKDSPKFWYKGKNWLTCLKLQPSNQEKRTGISFYNSPDELVTTMTMTNLRRSDSNRYWCAVKIRGSYVRTSLELTVIEGTPDLSAASSMVSGEEDGNVTVQCLYSDTFKDAEKKWCRSGDLDSCQTAEDIEPSVGAALQINDTNDGVYTVTLTGLKKTDAGWYWCMAGEVQVPVHISVNSGLLITEAKTRPFTSTTAQSFTTSNSSDANNHTATTPKLPESTLIQTEKTDQTSTVLTKQFSSSSNPTTTESSHYDRPHSSSTVSTTLTSRSTTPHTVTLSSKDLAFDPKTNRYLIWVIALVCGALLIFMLPPISWKLWSRHMKAITREEITETTTDIHANDRVDLLGNEWTNASVVQFSTDANTVLITQPVETSRTQR